VDGSGTEKKSDCCAVMKTQKLTADELV
jgi:hypothetical protein